MFDPTQRFTAKSAARPPEPGVHLAENMVKKPLSPDAFCNGFGIGGLRPVAARRRIG
jgi:hypothetical protein